MSSNRLKAFNSRSPAESWDLEKLPHPIYQRTQTTGNFDLIPEQEQALQQAQAALPRGPHRLESPTVLGRSVINNSTTQRVWQVALGELHRISLSSRARTCYLQQASMHFFKDSSWQTPETETRLNTLPEVIKYSYIQSYLWWTECHHFNQIVWLERPSSNPPCRDHGTSSTESEPVRRA